MMTEIAEVPLRRSPDLITRIAAWSAYASGTIGAISVIAFVIWAGAYAVTGRPAPRPIGWTNDVTSMLMYLLALPIPLALHQRLQARAPAISRVAMLIGLTGMVGVAVLQYLLVAGVLTFAQQGGPVTVAILLVGVWLVITGCMSRSSGTMPRAVLFSLLAVPYFGYPLWAFWLGRQLSHKASGTFAPNLPEEAVHV